MDTLELTLQTDSNCCANSEDLVADFIKNHSVGIADKLDLSCRNILYQSHIIIDNSQLDTIAREETTDRSNAIEIIQTAVSASGLRGVVGLVAAVRADRGFNDDDDDHCVLYKTMSNDLLYVTIKKCWLRSVLEQFCAN